MKKEHYLVEKGACTATTFLHDLFKKAHMQGVLCLLHATTSNNAFENLVGMVLGVYLLSFLNKKSAHTPPPQPLKLMQQCMQMCLHMHKALAKKFIMVQQIAVTLQEK
jgi:hypothetical protein